MSTVPSTSVEPHDLLPSLLAHALSLPDDEMLDWVSTCWMTAQTEAKGIPLDCFSPQLAEVIWLETLNASTDTAANALLLLVLQNTARGNRVGAAKMFRELMVGGAIDLVIFKQVAVSRQRQSERARKERGDEFTKVVRPWVKKDNNIPAEEVLRRLEVLAAEGHETIREVTPDVVRVASLQRGKGEVIRDISVSSVSSRISRLRKKV